MRNLWTGLLVVVLLCGCKSYSDNERLNYLDDAEKLLEAYRMVLDIDRSKFGVLGADYELQDIFERDLERFKRSYQGTDLEKDYKLLFNLSQAHENLKSYMLAAGSESNRKIAKALGSELSTTKTEDDDYYESTRERFVEKLNEIEQKIEKSR